MLDFTGTFNNRIPAPPAGLTEMAPGVRLNRQRANLAGHATARAVWGYGDTAGAAGATARLQWTLDFTGAAGWTDLTPSVAIDQVAAGAVWVGVSAFGAIPAAAQTDVMLRWVVLGGDTVAIPSWNLLTLELR